ncbi:MAG TPA: DUF86 domain-containing protein [Devosia sp.]
MATTPVNRLNHISERIELIKQLLDGVGFDQAYRDPTRWAAFERHLEVISEAAKNIPPDWKSEHVGSVDWQKVVGLGNILRHIYHHVSAPILWDIYLVDLDPLSVPVRALLAAHDDMDDA